MALTEFGKAVRKARIDAGLTLLTMANELSTSPSYLSALETGRKNIPPAWASAIGRYLTDKGCPVPNIEELAIAANGIVPLAGLSAAQKILIATFAKSPLDSAQLAKFTAFLAEINSAKGL